MTTFLLTTAISSAILLFGFIVLSVLTFGIQPSYSAFAAKWNEKVPLHNMHLWSICTIISALLLIPIMIEKGSENPLQFFGFIVPIYLIVVGLTPEYEQHKKESIVHTIAACVCAAIAIAWMFMVTHTYVFLPVCAFCALIVALGTDTLQKSLIFWGEMSVFLATYMSIFVI